MLTQTFNNITDFVLEQQLFAHSGTLYVQLTCWREYAEEILSLIPFYFVVIVYWEIDVLKSVMGGKINTNSGLYSLRENEVPKPKPTVF